MVQLQGLPLEQLAHLHLDGPAAQLHHLDLQGAEHHPPGHEGDTLQPPPQQGQG
jgi:hypothetical protein